MANRNGYIPPRPDFENNYPPMDKRGVIRSVPHVDIPELHQQPSLGDLVQDQHNLQTARDLHEREEILRDAIYRHREAAARAHRETSLDDLLDEMHSDANLTAQEVTRTGLPHDRVERLNTRSGRTDLPLYELFTDNVGHHKFQRKSIDPVYLAPTGRNGHRGLFVTSHGFSEQMGTLGLEPVDPDFLKHALSRAGRRLHVELPQGIYEAGKAYVSKAYSQGQEHGRPEYLDMPPGEARILKVRTALAHLIADSQNWEHEQAQQHRRGSHNRP